MTTDSRLPICGRFVAVLGVLGLGFTGTPSALGATQDAQIGQLAPSGASMVNCLSDLNAVQTNVSSGNSYRLPSAGVITSWQVRGISTSPATASLEVWRRVLGNDFQLVGKSTPEAFKQGKNVFPTQISAQAGDFLGLHTDAEIDGCAFNRGRGNIPLGIFGPDPLPGASFDFERTDTARLNLTATLENDANCDTLGGGSQASAVSGGCPSASPPRAAVLISRKGRMHRGKVLLKVSCPLHGGDCSDNTLKLKSIEKFKIGKLKLTSNVRAKRLTIGTARFSLAAGSTRRIRVKIGPKARWLLSTISPLSSRATIWAKSPIAQPKLTHRYVKIRR